MLTPTDQQEQRIQQVLNEPTQAALIASDAGQGKTLLAVEVIKRLNPTLPVLIVAPLSTFIGWERTIVGQGIELPVRRIDTTKKGPENYAAISNGEPGVYIIGHAMFRRKEWRKIALSVVVYDECHDFSNRKSLGFKTINTVKSQWRIAMSATFAGNKFQGAWAVTRWLWPTEVDRSFWRWAAEYAFVEFDPFAGKRVENEREPGKYVSTLPCYIRDRLELDTQYVEEVRYVDLSPTQRKHYQTVEDAGLLWLENNVHVASLPIVQRIRMRQVSLGVPTLIPSDDPEQPDIIDFKLDAKSTKMDALKEILAAHEGEPFLVLLDSAKFARVVVHQLGGSARLWSGEVPQEEREHLLKTFGKDYRTLVATIPSINAGTDGLQRVSNHVVWLSESDNNLHNTQARARLHRTGQTKNVLAWNIKASNTLDEGQYANLRLRELEMERSMSDDNSDSQDLNT